MALPEGLWLFSRASAFSVNIHHQKVWSGFAPKRILNLSQSSLSAQRIKIFSGYTRDCLPCPYMGVQSRYAGLCMGKVLQGKKNAFFFP
jgi:hypothetical protein